jgi:DNA-binding MarR family transcriptional regulator
MKAADAPVTPLARDSLAFLVMSLAGRLNRGASSYYQRHFEIGTAEFRILMSLGLSKGLNVGEVATAADVDKAAASRSLKWLQQRGLVQMEQTTSRGRAAIVHLTTDGQAFEKELRKAARRREKRFVATLSPEEIALAESLIHKLIGNVPAMNKD